MRRTARHLINVIVIASALTATVSAHGVGHAEERLNVGLVVVSLLLIGAFIYAVIRDETASRREMKRDLPWQ
ncbi:MAG TPA: hypothetical protein VK101_09915 [Limnochordia bacterium]|nr:hypothetical protein [Limnochordia bacterium]